MLENLRLRAAIAVSLGAIAGALCRYYVGLALTQTLGAGFPWGTFGVNLSGCFFMGLVTTVFARRKSFNPDALLLITTGFLGSYTTFSTYALETAELGDRPGLLPNLLYWLGSPVLGMACLALGMATANIVLPSHRGDRP